MVMSRLFWKKNVSRHRYCSCCASSYTEQHADTTTKDEQSHPVIDPWYVLHTHTHTYKHTHANTHTHTIWKHCENTMPVSLKSYKSLLDNLFVNMLPFLCGWSILLLLIGWPICCTWLADGPICCSWLADSPICCPWLADGPPAAPDWLTVPSAAPDWLTVPSTAPDWLTVPSAAPDASVFSSNKSIHLTNG